MLSIAQRKQIFEAILILKGSADEKAILDLSDADILNMLVSEACDTMVSFWNLVDRNEQLENVVSNFY
jgi:hypothetical protein